MTPILWIPTSQNKIVVPNHQSSFVKTKISYHQKQGNLTIALLNLKKKSMQYQPLMQCHNSQPPSISTKNILHQSRLLTIIFLNSYNNKGNFSDFPMHSVKLYVQRSHHQELSSSYEKRSLSPAFPSINDGFPSAINCFVGP